jgi:hypothetical protein
MSPRPATCRCHLFACSWPDWTTTSILYAIRDRNTRTDIAVKSIPRRPCGTSTLYSNRWRPSTRCPSPPEVACLLMHHHAGEISLYRSTYVDTGRSHALAKRSSVTTSWFTLQTNTDTKIYKGVSGGPNQTSGPGGGGGVERRNIQNTKICCGFLRTWLSSSDRRRYSGSLLWGLGATSIIS